MKEATEIKGMVGQRGALEFVNAFFAAPDGAGIKFGIGYGQRMMEYAVVACVNEFSAGFTHDEAIFMAETFERSVQRFPDAPEAGCLAKMAAAFRDCAAEVETLTNGVRQ